MSSPEIPHGTPRAVAATIKALDERWRWRLTLGHGYVTVAKPVADPREHGGRKTSPTRIPVDSIGLRLAHQDGRRAVAVWVRRSDDPKGAWTFDGPAYLWRLGEPARLVDAARFKAEVVRPKPAKRPARAVAT